eukprot:6291227-Prymnesium_polylepis.2
MLSPQAAAVLDEKHIDLGPRVVAVRLLTKQSGSSNDTLGILLISGYAPVSTASDAEWDAYYDSLGTAISRAHSRD